MPQNNFSRICRGKLLAQSIGGFLSFAAEDDSWIEADDKMYEANNKVKPKCADASTPTCPKTCPNGAAPPCKKVFTSKLFIKYLFP